MKDDRLSADGALQCTNLFMVLINDETDTRRDKLAHPGIIRNLDFFSSKRGLILVKASLLSDAIE